MFTWFSFDIQELQGNDEMRKNCCLHASVLAFYSDTIFYSVIFLINRSRNGVEMFNLPEKKIIECVIYNSWLSDH